MNSKLFSLVLILGLTLSFGGVTNVFANTNSTNTTLNVYNGTIYVSPNGDDSNNGFTPSTSKKTIQNAVYKAPSGCTVIVAPGTYTENTITIKKKLTLIGENPNNTIIQSKSDAINIYANGVLIKGFTITPKKYHSWNRGIYNKGHLTVENCIIKGFKAKSGAGIHSRDSILTVKNCIIVDNKSIRGYGGGIRSEGGSVTITDSVIANNTATGLVNGIGGGIALYTCTLYVQNSIIANNHADYGGGIWSHVSTVYLEDSIIDSNTANINGGGVYYQIVSPLILKNTTFRDNKPNDCDSWRLGGIFYS